MDRDNKNSEREIAEAAWERVVADRNERYPTLPDRSVEIYEYLQQMPGITSWDTTCFAASWLSAMAHQWPWLKEPAMQILALVSKAHYLMDEQELKTEGIKGGTYRQLRLDTETSKQEDVS